MAVSPLNHNVQMVTPEGKPTPEFMRWWQEFLSAVNPLAFPSGVSALFDILGTTQGAILYRSASAWALLPPGTSGRVLTTKGPSQNPSWDAVTVALSNVTGFPSFAGADAGDVLTVSSDTVPVLEWAPPTGGGDASAAENKTADYTVTDTDLSGGKFHTVGKASGDIFITVPASLTNNAELTVQNDDDATVNFLADGTTINSLNDYIGVPKFGVAKLRRTAANVFALYGDLITGETPPPEIPSSVTHFVQAADMIFNGSNRFTGFTDQVAASSAYVTINSSGPTGDTTNGINIETTGTSNYFSLNLFDGTRHFAAIWERNGNSYTACVTLDLNGSNYLAAAQSGSGSSISQGGSASIGASIRIAGTNYSPGSLTRGTLWTAAGHNVAGIKDIAIQSPSAVGSTFRPFQYPADTNFMGKLYLKGWAFYTDFSQTDDVIAALKG